MTSDAELSRSYLRMPVTAETGQSVAYWHGPTGLRVSTSEYGEQGPGDHRWVEQQYRPARGTPAAAFEQHPTFDGVNILVLRWARGWFLGLNFGLALVGYLLVGGAVEWTLGPAGAGLLGGWWLGGVSVIAAFVGGFLTLAAVVQLGVTGPRWVRRVLPTAETAMRLGMRTVPLRRVHVSAVRSKVLWDLGLGRRLVSLGEDGMEVVGTVGGELADDLGTAAKVAADLVARSGAARWGAGTLRLWR